MESQSRLIQDPRLGRMHSMGGGGESEACSRVEGVPCIVWGQEGCVVWWGWGVLYGRVEVHRMVRVRWNMHYVLRVG